MTVSPWLTFEKLKEFENRVNTLETSSGAGDAASVSYDASNSSLTENNLQGAVDQLAEFVSLTSTDYYVDSSSGSDVTGNGTQLNPWQTLEFAVNFTSSIIHKGSVRILLEDGTYTEGLIVIKPYAYTDVAGNSGAALTIESSSGTAANVIIAGTILIRGVYSGVIFENITIDTTSSSGCLEIADNSWVGLGNDVIFNSTAPAGTGKLIVVEDNSYLQILGTADLVTGGADLISIFECNGFSKINFSASSSLDISPGNTADFYLCVDKSSVIDISDVNITNRTNFTGGRVKTSNGSNIITGLNVNQIPGSTRQYGDGTNASSSISYIDGLPLDDLPFNSSVTGGTENLSVYTSTGIRSYGSLSSLLTVNLPDDANITRGKKYTIIVENSSTANAEIRIGGALLTTITPGNFSVIARNNLSTNDVNGWTFYG